MADSLEEAAPARKYSTPSVVLLDVPKLDILAPIPLFAIRSNQPVDGKVPLEEWSGKELRSFRDSLASFSGELRVARGFFSAEENHLSALREKQEFPIPFITEAEQMRSKTSGTHTSRPKSKFFLPHLVHN